MSGKFWQRRGGERVVDEKTAILLQDNKSDGLGYEDRPYPKVSVLEFYQPSNGVRISQTRDEFLNHHCTKIVEGGYTSAEFEMSQKGKAGVMHVFAQPHFLYIQAKLLNEMHQLRSLSLTGVTDDINKKDSESGLSSIEGHIINPIKRNPRQLETVTINGRRQHKDWNCVPIGAQPPAPKPEGGCCLVM